MFNITVLPLVATWTYEEYIITYCKAVKFCINDDWRIAVCGFVPFWSETTSFITYVLVYSCHDFRCLTFANALFSVSAILKLPVWPVCSHFTETLLITHIARHVGPTLAQRGADRIHVGPTWGQRCLLSRYITTLLPHVTTLVEPNYTGILSIHTMICWCVIIVYIYIYIFILHVISWKR